MTTTTAGIVGVLAFVRHDLGVKAQAVALLGYGIYLFQAAMLHGYRYFTDEKKMPIRLWRYCLLTALVAGMMIFFGISAALG